ncbi:MAG: hypothetical protein ABIV47_16435 [Roseiflexaceae bacterium]
MDDRQLRDGTRAPAAFRHYGAEPIVPQSCTPGENGDNLCAEIGHDQATLRRTWFGWAVCATTSKEAQAIAVDYGGFVGTPAEVTAQFEPYIAVGFDHFMLISPQFPDPTSIELFKREVIPVLQAKYNISTE